MDLRRAIGLILTFAILVILSPACSAGTPAVKSNVANQQGLVRQSLDGLIAAYTDKNIRRFMELVSESYTGDPSILESSIQSDYSTFTDIAIRYTFNNVTYDGKDMVSASITFVRDHTVIKTTKRDTVRKQTTLIFRREDGVYKLYSQNGSVLFGAQ
jgi:hypothetical protein